MKTFPTLALSLLMLLTLSACNPQQQAKTEKTVSPPPVAEESTADEEPEESTETTPSEAEASQPEGEEVELGEEEPAVETPPQTEAEEKSTETAASSAPFAVEAYTAARFAELKGNTPVVINFHATWCPKCQKLDKTIKENLSSLPAGTVMLKADYDTETELKKTYGITLQTTLVFFDANGEQIAKENNPSLEKIKQLLSS